jgi:pilus assembly protein CpaF
MQTNSHSRERALEMVFNSLGVLRELFEDPAVQEIMINGPDKVFVERAGQMEQLDITESQIRSAITVLAARAGKELRPDTKDCILNERWVGVRVCAVMPPVALDGPVMSIRKHSSVKLTLADYVERDVFSEDVRSALGAIVKQRKNVLIAGGTGSGKTTFLKALIDEIDPEDRIISIEDLPELDIRRPNTIALETREAVGIDFAVLVQTALRLRPDRIIMGEVRGSAAIDLLNAANTGHEGCLSTLHANSSFEALSRFEDMIQMSGTSIPLTSIQQRIASTFEYVVFMARRSGKRRLVEIMRLQGFDPLQQKYKFDYIYQEK